ncbi:metallophosphoesterase family protein [Heliorestis convoluta]|uniref:Metallophosphoesterase family protein n=1 Tax=Heliorestis convoluta TaxID=356322 RepID=A0A5Q2MY51_9FIRM|nr:metallophosphoesterase family protein [Heliorestis convoluta]QGG47794.1 metallophosphoesterase family protein [Heliorestis convoluta]
MRYGIISDIHGNVNALKNALNLLRDVDQIVFLGDVPNHRNGKGFQETLEILHRENVKAVRGNCDAYVLSQYRSGEIDESLWNFYASWPIEDRKDNEILWVHGGPRDPLGERIVDEERAWKNFHAQDFRICFHGHQHTVTCFEYEQGDVRSISLQEGVAFYLHDHCRYIVGVGSVGDPRDSSRGSLVLYNQSTSEIVVKRLPID